MNRANLIVNSLATCPPLRWERFVVNLCLDKPLEFDEGDIGPDGGMQKIEASSANPVLTDMILRYGGSTSADLPWPDATKTGHEEEDRFDKLEAMLQKTVRKMKKGSIRKPGAAQGKLKMSMMSAMSGSLQSSSIPGSGSLTPSHSDEEEC